MANAYFYSQLTGPRQMTVNGQTMDASVYYLSEVLMALCSLVIYSIALVLNRRRHKLVTEYKAQVAKAIVSSLD